MNYKHVYHAGSFSDVTKHILSIALLNTAKRKETPFCYIDTHGGAGYYDLYSESAGKTKEYENGIEKIIQADRPPALVKSYLDILHQVNNKLSGAKYASMRYYPGSPLIARHLLRAHDRMIACELHPEEYQSLRNTFAGDKQVSIHHTDGYLGLKAFLPPKERRGIILIDPPYENPDEFTHMAHSLPAAFKRFNTGVYAIWYPIKEKAQTLRFHQAMRAATDLPLFVIELTIYPDIAQHLNGTGLLVVNPPWQFDNTVTETLPWLWKALTINNQGGFHTYFLK